MTWAARYSRTEQPELTIYHDDHEHHWPVDEAEVMLGCLPDATGDLRADIAARVPVTECGEPGCVHWAMPDGRCHHLHGGSDEL